MSRTTPRQFCLDRYGYPPEERAYQLAADLQEAVREVRSVRSANDRDRGAIDRALEEGGVKRAPLTDPVCAIIGSHRALDARVRALSEERDNLARELADERASRVRATVLLDEAVRYFQLDRGDLCALSAVLDAVPRPDPPPESYRTPDGLLRVSYDGPPVPVPVYYDDDGPGPLLALSESVEPPKVYEELNPCANGDC